MANEFDYFPMYVRRFLSDEKVEVMDATAVGAYVLLLFKAWDQVPVGSLPADSPEVLARWARVSPDEWTRIGPRVLAPFVLRSDGRLYSKRLAEVFRDLRKKRKALQEAGKRGGSKSARNKQLGLQAEALFKPGLKGGRSKEKEREKETSPQSPPKKPGGLGGQAASAPAAAVAGGGGALPISDLPEPTDSAKALWRAAIEKLRGGTVQADSFAAWIQPLRLVSWDGGTVVAMGESRYQTQKAREYFGKEILGALQAVDPSVRKVEYLERAPVRPGVRKGEARAEP